MQFDWSAIWDAIPLLLEGAKLTLGSRCWGCSAA